MLRLVGRRGVSARYLPSGSVSSFELATSVHQQNRAFRTAGLIPNKDAGVKKSFVLSQLPLSVTQRSLRDSLKDLEYRKLQLEPGLSIHMMQAADAHFVANAVSESEDPYKATVASTGLPCLVLRGMPLTASREAVLQAFKAFEPLDCASTGGVAVEVSTESAKSAYCIVRALEAVAIGPAAASQRLKCTTSVLEPGTEGESGDKYNIRVFNFPISVSAEEAQTAVQSAVSSAGAGAGAGTPIIRDVSDMSRALHLRFDVPSTQDRAAITECLRQVIKKEGIKCEVPDLASVPHPAVVIRNIARLSEESIRELLQTATPEGVAVRHLQFVRKSKDGVLTRATAFFDSVQEAQKCFKAIKFTSLDSQPLSVSYRELRECAVKVSGLPPDCTPEEVEALFAPHLVVDRVVPLLSVPSSPTSEGSHTTQPHTQTSPQQQEYVVVLQTEKHAELALSSYQQGSEMRGGHTVCIEPMDYSDAEVVLRGEIGPETVQTVKESLNKAGFSPKSSVLTTNNDIRISFRTLDQAYGARSAFVRDTNRYLSPESSNSAVVVGTDVSVDRAYVVQLRNVAPDTSAAQVIQSVSEQIGNIAAGAKLQLHRPVTTTTATTAATDNDADAAASSTNQAEISSRSGSLGQEKGGNSHVDVLQVDRKAFLLFARRHHVARGRKIIGNVRLPVDALAGEGLGEGGGKEGAVTQPLKINRYVPLRPDGDSEYDVQGGAVERFNDGAIQQLMLNYAEAEPSLKFEVMRNAFERALLDATITGDAMYIVDEISPPALRDEAQALLKELSKNNNDNNNNNNKGAGSAFVSAASLAANARLFEIYMQKKELQKLTANFDEFAAVLGAPDESDPYNWSQFALRSASVFEEYHTELRKVQQLENEKQLRQLYGKDRSEDRLDAALSQELGRIQERAAVESERALIGVAEAEIEAKARTTTATPTTTPTTTTTAATTAGGKSTSSSSTVSKAGAPAYPTEFRFSAADILSSGPDETTTTSSAAAASRTHPLIDLRDVGSLQLEKETDGVTVSLMDPATLRDKDGNYWSGLIVDTDMVQKTTPGNRVGTHRVLVVVGNMKGAAGFGMGKGRSPADALNAAFRASLRNLLHIDLYDNFGLAHDLFGQHNACKAYLRATPRSRQMVASPLVGEILVRFGIGSASVKLEGRRNPYSQVRAVFDALSKHQNIDVYAKLRGKRYLTLRWLAENGI